MDKYPSIKKYLAVGIILLFVGTSIIPVTAQEKEKPSLPTSSGNWLYVGGSGPGNISKIQDAINDSQDGDTVFVFHGTYYEHIVINKAIYLIGENVNTTTIIDNFSHDIYAMTIQRDNVTVIGFTIQGEATWCAIGLGSGYTTIKGNNILSTYGMEVKSSNNSILYNNITGYGIPLTGLGCGINSILSNNRIEHNSIFSAATGISVAGDGNFINNNLIVASWPSDIHGSKNVISNNTFQNSGLRSYGSVGNIVTNNTVKGKPLVFLVNTSNKVLDYDAGQVILIQCDNVTIKNQNFSHSPRSIQVLGSTNCHIINNTISYCSDAGIAIYYSDTIMVMDNTINTSPIKIGRYDFGYCYNISISRNTFTGESTILNNVITFENTCNSTLSYNNLVNTFIELLDFCRNCKICCNNFMVSNGFDIRVPLFSHNTFYRNYWWGPRLFPIHIHGTVYIGPKWPYSLILPWFFIDWHPALKPYDIPG